MPDLKMDGQPAKPRSVGTIRWEESGVKIHISAGGSLSCKDVAKLKEVARALAGQLSH